MNARFDNFYDEQPQVMFTRCARGQLLEVEGPLKARPFSSP